MPEPALMRSKIARVDEIKHLARGKIFRIFANGLSASDSVVVKHEIQAANRKDLSHNLSTMKRVSPAAQAKVLDKSERDAIIAKIDDEFFIGSYFGYQQDQYLAAFRQLLTSGNGQFYKMPVYEGLVDIGMAMDDDSKAPSRQIAKALNQKGGFESLGKIIAGDMYVHNADRFDLGLAYSNDPNAGGSKNARTQQSFQCLVNPGNVMVAVISGKSIPVGLDSFDPYSPFRDLNKTIEAIESNDDEKWWGRLMLNNSNARGNRAKLSKMIVEDLEAALAPRDRCSRFFRQTRLNSNGPRRVLKGIEQGVNEIIAKARSTIISPLTKPGIASRIKILLAKN